MKVHNPMISYHSLEGGKSDRVMGVDAHPDVCDGIVVFATVGGGGSGEVRIWSIAPGDEQPKFCLLYTSPSPRDQRGSRMPSSA